MFIMIDRIFIQTIPVHLELKIIRLHFLTYIPLRHESMLPAYSVSKVQLIYPACLVVCDHHLFKNRIYAFEMFDNCQCLGATLKNKLLFDRFDDITRGVNFALMLYTISFTLFIELYMYILQ